jgi:hypothetical protein
MQSRTALTVLPYRKHAVSLPPPKRRTKGRLGIQDVWDFALFSLVLWILVRRFALRPPDHGERLYDRAA